MLDDEEEQKGCEITVMKAVLTYCSGIRSLGNKEPRSRPSTGDGPMVKYQATVPSCLKSASAHLLRGLQVPRPWEGNQGLGREGTQGGSPGVK